MLKKLFLLILMFLLIISISAYSQVKKGMKEIDLSGNISGISDGDEKITVFQISLTYGHFISNKFEIGGKFSAIKLDRFDASGNLAAFIAYYFKESENSKLLPYIGFEGGMGFLDDHTDTSHYGGFCGIKIFFSEKSAISVQPYYLIQNSTREDRSYYGLMLGITNFF